MRRSEDRRGEQRVDRYRRALADRFASKSANLIGAVVGFLGLGIVAVSLTGGRSPEAAVLAQVIGAVWGYRLAGRGGS